MDRITDQIAIGHFLDTQSLTEEIGAVLCLRKDFCETRTDVDALCVPLIDGPGNDPRDFEDALAFIEELFPPASASSSTAIPAAPGVSSSWPAT